MRLELPAPIGATTDIARRSVAALLWLCGAIVRLLVATIQVVVATVSLIVTMMVVAMVLAALLFMSLLAAIATVAHF